MRIMGIERDKTACSYYRILQPLCKLDELDMAEVAIVREEELDSDKALNSALWADLIVFQRPATEAWVNFIKTCRKYGKLIVSDYDDDPFNTSPLNPYYQYIGTEEVRWQWPDGTTEWLWSEDMVSASGNKIFNIERNINHRDMFKLNFKKSNLVTCTTELLRQEFLKINPNVSVLPNLIDPQFFMTAEMVKRDIRIGWQGGASHYEDLYMVKDHIIEILKTHDNVKFVFFGDSRFQNLFNKAPKDKIEFHNWVSHSVYPYKLGLLNLDIGICPLVDNQFNRNKSAIKWMEYSAIKVMTLASDVSPYKELIRNNENGMLVKDSDWTLALGEAIKDVSLRQRIANHAYEDVMENHNANKKANLWIDAYNQLLKGDLVLV